MFANINYLKPSGWPYCLLHAHAAAARRGTVRPCHHRYRYYGAPFLAAKVAMLDDTRITPAHQFNDGQNYHPTNKWVLFGHHFAAISGRGRLSVQCPKRFSMAICQVCYGW